MKKIFSIISAFVLCASFAVTSVNAELSYDSENDVVTMPTMEELKARTPEITLSAEKAADKAAVQAAGIPSKQAGNYIKAEWDTYVVTATVTKVGNLAASYTDDTYETMAGVVNPGTVLSFTNSDKIQKYAVGTTPYADASQVGVDGTLNFTFGSATNVGYSYPTFDSEFNGSGLTAPTIEVKFVICVTAGESLDLVVEDASFYYIWKNGDAIDKHIAKPVVDTITLGESAPVEPEEPEEPAPSKSFLASLRWGATAQAAKGVAFTVTDATDAENVKTSKAWPVPFGDKTQFESLGSITVGLNITEIPDTVDVNKLTATGELY
jgi:hypothetical protein